MIRKPWSWYSLCALYSAAALDRPEERPASPLRSVLLPMTVLLQFFCLSAVGAQVALRRPNFAETLQFFPCLQHVYTQ